MHKEKVNSLPKGWCYPHINFYPSHISLNFQPSNQKNWIRSMDKNYQRYIEGKTRCVNSTSLAINAIRIPCEAAPHWTKMAKKREGTSSLVLHIWGKKTREIWYWWVRTKLLKIICYPMGNFSVSFFLQWDNIYVYFFISSWQGWLSIHQTGKFCL